MRPPNGSANGPGEERAPGCDPRPSRAPSVGGAPADSAPAGGAGQPVARPWPPASKASGAPGAPTPPRVPPAAAQLPPVRPSSGASSPRPAPAPASIAPRTSDRYAVPASLPVYVESTKSRRTGRRAIGPLVDAGFIVVSLVCAVWYAGAMLVASFTPSPLSAVLIIAFYALLAYLVLPRLHQVFTVLYVPDYFIGRTRTPDGLLGDPVNLALDGRAADIHAAMRRAGWTLADEITVKSTLRIISSTVLRRPYAEAPVSPLTLFGRRHDFAYQQEVGGNAAKRHHVRFWRVPDGWRLPGGERVDWLAAGTYDRAVGFSAFTGQVTHKIDDDVDLERDYIVRTLRYADPRIGVRVIADFSTAYHHRNGGGDLVRTDGDLPVVGVGGAFDRADESVRRVSSAPARRDPGDHAIPPFGLLIAGFLAVLTALNATLGVIDLLGSDEAQQAVMSGGSDAPIVGVVLVAIALVVLLLSMTYLVLWGLTLMRLEWARFVFMVLLALDTVLSLAASDVEEPWGPTRFVSVGLTLLSLLAISGRAVREWTAARRLRRA